MTAFAPKTLFRSTLFALALTPCLALAPASAQQASAQQADAGQADTGQANTGQVQIETATGPMTFERPETFAALDVAAIDTLAALGVVPDGIVTPLYLDFLEEQVETAQSVGTMFEADIEKLAVLQPDLIILGARAVAQSDMLSRLAPVVDMSIGPDAFGDGIARLQAYGTLFGREAEAAALQDQLDAALARARRAVADTGGRALILLTNGPKISAYGAGSRFGWLHDRLNWPEAIEGIETSNHGEPVSFEYVARANPDTILVVDRGTTVGEGAQTARATLDNALVHRTRAWQDNRIVYLSPPEAYVAAGGVQSLMSTLQMVSDALIGAED